MRKIVLDEKTKNYVKNYYVNSFLNNIECNGLNVKDYKKDLKNLVDETITLFLNNKNDLDFPSFMSRKYQKYVQKNNIKRLSPRDFFLLAKNNSKYIKNLYKHYENLMIYQIYNSTKDVDEKRLDESKELLKAYFDSFDITKVDNFENFSHSIAKVRVNIYFKLGIKTNNAIVRNEQIAVKEGSLTAKENSKKHFKTLYLSKINNYKSILPKEKLKIYIKSVIDKLIENYCDNKPNSSLPNYLFSQLGRILKELNDDIVLIKYARIINNDTDYDYAIDYYQKKYEYILDEYDKNYGLIEKYKELVEEYVKSAHLNKNIESYLKLRLNEFIKENSPENINFDLDLARGSNEVEKQRHRHILLTEFKYKIDLYKKAYKFYDSEKMVDKKLKEIYIDAIDSYINGSRNDLASRYLSTVLKQRFKSYSKSIEKQKYFANILFIVNSYYEILEEYYNKQTLTYTEKGNLEEYMGLILDEYIENGCYKDDHKEYFRKMIENYENIDKSYVYKK